MSSLTKGALPPPPPTHALYLNKARAVETSTNAFSRTVGGSGWQGQAQRRHAQKVRPGRTLPETVGSASVPRPRMGRGTRHPVRHPLTPQVETTWATRRTLVTEQWHTSLRSAGTAVTYPPLLSFRGSDSRSRCRSRGSSACRNRASFRTPRVAAETRRTPATCRTPRP